MFLAHRPGMPARAVENEADAEGVTWLDLLNPTPQEHDLASHLCGQPVPTFDDLNEIESSSRISVRNGAAFLSTPMLKKIGTEFQASPVGFILTADRLITIRFQAYPSFEALARLVADHTIAPKTADHPPAAHNTGTGTPSISATSGASPVGEATAPQTSKPAATPQTIPPSAPGGTLGAGEIMVALIETIVDRLADILESVGALLDTLSQDIFRKQRSELPRHNIAAWQRNLLQRVGSSGDLCSRMRDTLLGLERLTIFLGESKKDGAAPSSGFPLTTRRFEAGVTTLPTENAPYALSGALRARMTTANRDLSSLTDYVAQAAAKVEFLLDATLGFISIEQNGMMKVLTVVSFIGVAPTLIAGVYGMNFKDIPELGWRYGYWYSLALMTASVVLPLVWFWRKGWLGGIK